MTTSTAVGWIRRFHPSAQARSRLVCFPHAGGSASFYHAVSAALNPSIEVLAVQYPGRQDRWDQPFVTTIEGLAEQATEALLPWLDLPVSLFGHSMGAAVAFETARRLEATGAPVRRLFTSGRRAPSIGGDSAVYKMPDQDLITEIRNLAGTNSELLLDGELRQLLLPVIRADYQAIETYLSPPGRRVSCPVTALVGSADHRVPLPEVQVWRDHCTGDFEIQEFPGGHFYLSEYPDAVLELVRRRLSGGSR